MKAIAVIFLFCLGSVPILGEEVKRPIRTTPANRAPDLDFTAEEDVLVPEKAAVQVSSGSAHPWIYWTLGFSAAAGGMAFYLWESGKSSAPTKTVQVFTDDPG
jgi:hypothetical protein